MTTLIKEIQALEVTYFAFITKIGRPGEENSYFDKGTVIDLIKKHSAERARRLREYVEHLGVLENERHWDMLEEVILELEAEGK